MKVNKQNMAENPSKIYKINDMPFLVGVFDRPQNPSGLPDVLPFSYFEDPDTGILKQQASEEVSKNLEKAYRTGSLIGTPMNADGDGQAYLQDFWKFIQSCAPDLSGKAVLEIGCGKGYLLKILQEKSGNAIGVEPGNASKDSWAKNGVKVVNDFFPTNEIQGKFDIIVSYCVLEHIEDDKAFLSSMIEQMEQDGRILIAVPNCEEQLEKCDPSMFVHEHYSYHSLETLKYLMTTMGLEVASANYSDFGGLLYICAKRSDGKVLLTERPAFDLETFSKKTNDYLLFLEKEIAQINQSGRTLGIYCAARAIAGLPLDGSYRFFDDDPYLHGLYYPPFNVPIENRMDLIAKPVDELWIFSYSFGDKIQKKLREHPELHSVVIKTLDNLKS